MSFWKTPKFWYHHDKNTVSKLLKPAEYLYDKVSVIHRQNQSKNAYTSHIPVICVGNITAGGSGKTPTCIAIYQLLKSKGIALDPVFLTRGYGGSLNGPERVRGQGSAKTWGDEALLLARYGSVIKSKNRVKGAYYAEDLNADCILMDDGAQNERLSKTITLIVINGKNGFGNKKQIPAGPLREKLESGLNRADGFILIGDDKAGVHNILPKDKPLFKANIVTSKSWKLEPNKPYVGFAGIAFPENFKNTLIENNINLKDFKAFADHHFYTDNDIKILMGIAKSHNATLITTEKDYVRIPNSFDKNRIETLPIDLHFEDEKAVAGFLKKNINPEGS